MKFRDPIEVYAGFLAKNPLLILILSLIITGLGFMTYSSLETKNPGIDEIVPAELPVVASLMKLQHNLGGGEGTAFMIVFELEPEFENGINDIRDPRIANNMLLISNQVRLLEDVTGTEDMANSMMRVNSGNLPNTLTEAIEIQNENPALFSRIVNDKYSMALIRIYAQSDFDVSYLVYETQKIIDNSPSPSGVSIQLAGEAIAQQISEDMTGPDSQKTTNISLLGIIIILIIIFRSPLYSVLPLFTIIFGVMWTIAFMALVGLGFSPFTAGAISMIVGIGIDFGIQTIVRFKQELAAANPVSAMEQTLKNVLKPMTQATIAAFIGFWAMTYADFMIVGELGRIMAIGVVFCFFAAATVVPAISLLFEIHKPNVHLNSPSEIFRRMMKIIQGEKRF